MILADRLIAAKALVDAGWTKGKCFERIKGQPCYCALGAIAKVNGWSPEMQDEAIFSMSDRFGAQDIQHVANILQNGTRAPMSTIFIWQDKPGVTKEDVLVLFDAAIAQAFS